VRRSLTLIISFVLISLFVSPAANSASVVLITEPTHRLSDGVFFDDQLSFELTPAGRLGRLVYLPSQEVRSWQVDPATISEIMAMGAGYGVVDGGVASGQIIAQQWLAQFIKVSKPAKVSYITYGNPSAYWANEISKNQLTYVNALSKINLETALGKAVVGAAPISGVQQSLSKPAINIVKYGQRQINLLATVVGQKELDQDQLRLMQLLNSNLNDEKLNMLIKDFDQSVTKTRSKLKIKSTKFTVTSENEELPITIVNDFDSAVKLKLSTRALNSKVEVAPVEEITVAAKSKQQILLPLKVLAPGESRLLTQLTNLENKPVGYPVYINLKLSVISPVATWITSGAAILLFIAALVQSVRRVRRRK
jgi:hypothetical protein